MWSHRSARVAAVAACAAALTWGSLSPATAAGDSSRVPPRAWITIKGHGYGHGHGMSQYGAEGAARRGLNFRQIAAFYYRGTRWGTAGGRMRVRISADISDDLVVKARSGLRVRHSGTRKILELPRNGASRWRITVDRTGGDRVSYLTDRWHDWRGVRGPAGFTASGAPVALVTPSGTRTYRGRLMAVAPSRGSRARNTINVVSLEGYLKGVVPLEMPASWSKAAVRAQAVAARTYAAYERAHRSGPICDTTSCQVYGGRAAEHRDSNAAILATRELVLTHRGVPAFTQFSSSSGGWTSAGSMPYLKARKDPYDGWAGNPVHTWRIRVKDTLFESRWPSIGNLRRIAVRQRDGNGQWGGRIRSIAIIGGRGRVVVSGDTLRSALGLRSTWLTFGVTRRG